MISGFFRVGFSAFTDGVGLVAIDDGKIRGADYSYMYAGEIEEGEYGNIKMTLRMSPYIPNSQSIFGQTGEFEVELSGRSNGTEFELTGESPLPGQPGIVVMGQKIHNLDLRR